MVRRALDQRPPGGRFAAFPLCAWRLLSALLAVLLIPGLLAGRAQSTTTGGLEGTITDAQGRVVPGVRVIAWSDATGKQRATTSDAAGSFRIADLDPDTYAVDITVANFAPWRAASVV